MKSLFPVLRTSEIINYPTFDLIDKFFEDFRFSSLFDGEKEWAPKIDVSETEKELIVKAELPGIEKDNINITLTDGLLTISGENKHEKEDKKENYHLIERRYGSFSRTLRVPNGVETEKIDANYKDGILKVTLPKKEEARAKKIEVK